MADAIRELLGADDASGYVDGPTLRLWAQRRNVRLRRALIGAVAISTALAVFLAVSA